MLKINPILPEDAIAFSQWLASQSAEYRKYFHPFSDESEEGLANMLASVRRDRYRMILFGEEWVGFFMLRGWDAGYERPSFGLLVDERYAGKGVGTFCLRAAITECRLMGTPSCMLKVAPENRAARAIYEKAGFRFEAICPTTGDEMLAIQWDS